MISKLTLVDVPEQEVDNDVSDNDDPTTRVIKYHLGPDFLKLSTVGLTLNFGIGPKEVKNM
jgi:hypothetical protein